MAELKSYVPFPLALDGLTDLMHVCPLLKMLAKGVLKFNSRRISTTLYKITKRYFHAVYDSVVTNGSVYNYYSWNTFYSFPLSGLMDGGLGVSQSYITTSQNTNVTLTFPYPTLVSHLHIFPLCR